MIKRIKRKYTLIVMSSVIVVLGLIITAINVANYTSINSLLDEKVTMLVDNEGLMPDLPFGEKPGESEDEGGSSDGESGENGSSDDESQDHDTDNNGSSGEGGENQEQDGNGAAGGGESSSTTDKGDGDSGEDTKEDGKKEEESYQHMSPETPYELRYFSVKLDTDGMVLAVDTSKIAAINTEKAEKYAKEIFDSGDSKGFIDSYKYKVGTTKDGNLIFVFLDADRELNSLRSFLISSLVITAFGILTVFALVVLFSETVLKPIIESYEKQKRFITDAGHEMKTPLTVISANAEIIEMENGESQWLSGIKKQVSKLASLTEKLVFLSKMEEDVKLEMYEFSLSEALFDTCDQYKSIALSKDIRFELDIAENVRMVGSESDIRRCISLLLDNAFRYVNDGGFVQVRAHSVVSGVEMQFKNSAEGVEKGSLDNWFDRFYRADLSRSSDTGGSGIGLSVVKAIVIAHNGNVRAYSDGSAVEFTINI